MLALESTSNKNITLSLPLVRVWQVSISSHFFKISPYAYNLNVPLKLFYETCNSSSYERKERAWSNDFSVDMYFWRAPTEFFKLENPLPDCPDWSWRLTLTDANKYVSNGLDFTRLDIAILVFIFQLISTTAFGGFEFVIIRSYGLLPTDIHLNRLIQTFSQNIKLVILWRSVLIYIHVLVYLGIFLLYTIYGNDIIINASLHSDASFNYFTFYATFENWK